MRDPLSFAQIYDALLSLLGERGALASQIGQRSKRPVSSDDQTMTPFDLTWRVGETIFLAEEFLPHELQEGLWSQFHLMYSRRYTAKRAAAFVWNVWRREGKGGGEGGEGSFA